MVFPDDTGPAPVIHGDNIPRPHPPYDPTTQCEPPGGYVEPPSTEPLPHLPVHFDVPEDEQVPTISGPGGAGPGGGADIVFPPDPLHALASWCAGMY